MGMGESGLKQFSPVKNACLYVFYEPINKIYFIGTFKSVYPLYYTSVESKVIMFGHKCLAKFVSGKPMVDILFSKEMKVA